MFCPTCGSEYQIELKYCNRCGANLMTALKPTEMVSVDVTKAIAAIGTTMTALTLGGFIALIIGAVKLAEKTNLGTDPIMMTVVLGMTAILTADIFLGIQLSRLIKSALSLHELAKRKPAPVAPVEFSRPTTARLSPAASVTENTTRFFEAPYQAPAEVPMPATERPRKE